MLQSKEESEDIQVDIGAVTLQHMDSHYRSKPQEIDAVKLESSTKNQKIDTALCRGVKQELVEIDLTSKQKLQTNQDEVQSSCSSNVVQISIAGCSTSEAGFSTNLKKRITTAEYQQEYRACKKAERENKLCINNSPSKVCFINTVEGRKFLAESQRKYRARKKAQCEKSRFLDDNTDEYRARKKAKCEEMLCSNKSSSKVCFINTVENRKLLAESQRNYRARKRAQRDKNTLLDDNTVEYRAHKNAEHENMQCNNNSPSKVCFLNTVERRKLLAESQRKYRACKKAQREKSRLEDNTSSNVLDVDEQPTDPSTSNEPLSDVESSSKSQRQTLAAYLRAYRVPKKSECENMLANNTVPNEPSTSLISEPSTSAAVDVMQDHNSQNTSVVKTESKLAHDVNDPVLCSRVNEETGEDKRDDPRKHNECIKEFKLESYFHVQVTHSGKLQYECAVCKRIYKSKQCLWIHVLQEHPPGSLDALTFTEPKIHICKFCGEGTVSRQHLDNHVNHNHRQQSIEPKFHICKICGERTKSRQDLHNHVNNIHRQQSLVSPFVNRCFICQKIYCSKSYLTIHIRNFHEKRSHRCFECKMDFHSEAYLQRHIKMCDSKEYEEQNQQSSCSNTVEDTSVSTHPTVDEVNVAASASTLQQNAVVIKEESADEEIELGPVVFQHMDSNYRPYKEEPQLKRDDIL